MKKAHKAILLKCVYIKLINKDKITGKTIVKSWRIKMRKKTYLNMLEIIRTYFKKKYNSDTVYFIYDNLTK